MDTEDRVSEQVGIGRRRSSAATTPLSACSADGQQNTQNALIKSLLNKLRLSGSKLKNEKFEKFNFSIPGSSSLDTPLNQGKQVDQLDRNGRLSTGASPFELGRGLPPSQRPSPTAHVLPAGDPTVSDATPKLPVSAGPGVGASVGSIPLAQAQRSLDAALAMQQSWSSPRAEAFRSSETGAMETLRAWTTSPLGNLNASLNGGNRTARKYIRPSNVPPLNLAKLSSQDRSRRQSKQGQQAGGSGSPLVSSASPAGPAPPAGPQSALGTPAAPAQLPLTPHQYQQQLLESLADLDEELASWTAPPKWNPSNQGRWYLYPPIGRQDVTPVEQLVESLNPSQAAAVVLLWRQYAAARYSAELMAGRAVRLCRELSHELSDCRAEVEERTQRHTDHAAQLGKAVMRLQQQLEEARRAAAAATLAAAQATSQAAAQAAQAAQAASQATAQPTNDAGAASDQQAPHHHLRNQLNQPTPAHSSPVRRQSSRTAPGAAPSPHVSQEGSLRGSSAGGWALASKDKDTNANKKVSARPAAAEGVGAPPEGLASGKEDLAAQLEQMRTLFLEAHEDSRALREALMEVDEQNMQLYEQSNGLRRHASAVLRENDALRQEVAQLRGMLAGAVSGVASGPPSAVADASGALRRPTRTTYGGKSTGGGASETGLRASLSLPPGEHLMASPPPPRRPPVAAIGSAAGGNTPTSASAQKSEGGSGVIARTSVRRGFSTALGTTSIGEALSSAAVKEPAPLPPPVPPSRTSARPAAAGSTSHRGPGIGSGRQPTELTSAAYGTTTTAAAAAADALQGLRVTSGGDRNTGRTLSEAVATEGAVVVVQASRRVSNGHGGGSSGALQPVARVRPTEPALAGVGHPSAATVASGKGHQGSGGVFSDGSIGGTLHYSADERMFKAQVAVTHHAQNQSRTAAAVPPPSAP